MNHYTTAQALEDGYADLAEAKHDAAVNGWGEIHGIVFVDDDPHRIPTNERCEHCDSLTFIEPGYLTSNPLTGARWFTVCRVTEHDDDCPMLDIEDSFED